ncbi:hypothetical protein [Corallibacter sp.]
MKNLKRIFLLITVITVASIVLFSDLDKDETKSNALSATAVIK